MFSATSITAIDGQLAGRGMIFCSSWKLVNSGFFVSNHWTPWNMERKDKSDSDYLIFSLYKTDQNINIYLKQKYSALVFLFFQVLGIHPRSGKYALYSRAPCYAARPRIPWKHSSVFSHSATKLMAFTFLIYVTFRNWRYRQLQVMWPGCWDSNSGSLDESKCS